jgi:hypothetical protein
MLNSLGLANKVKLHLTYSVMWSNIITLTIQQQQQLQNKSQSQPQSTPSSSVPPHLSSSLINPDRETFVLKGVNPKTGEQEYVLPISKRSKVTLQNLDLLFQNIEEVEGLDDKALEKILMGIVDTDGSILFYYVHRGVKNFSD